MMNKLTAALVVAFLVPAAAWAKPCGDDVAGRDVACACGDQVVSSVVLGDDPVTREVCERDGLIVRAITAAAPVTVDLNGKTLRGRGKGTGVLLLSGGPGHTRVISSGAVATITGFNDGIFAHGRNALGLIDNVLIDSPGRDGIRAASTDYEIHRTEVRKAGRDAFSLGGRTFRVTGTRAVESKRMGYFVMGQGGLLGSGAAVAVAEDNGDAGFSLGGSGHQLHGCVTRRNGKQGLRLNAAGLVVQGCRADGNGADGIGGMAGDSQFAGNTATANLGAGIDVEGPGIVDEGGNRGSGNHGGNAAEGGAEPVQCEIARQDCQ